MREGFVPHSFKEASDDKQYFQCHGFKYYMEHSKIFPSARTKYLIKCLKSLISC